ncbi:MAG: hypothetical protein Ct9H300mP27_11120 [Chloroflexota bacterium]|nr:MAG: hypothetical protein Ct9H300mP27_11120 [Chloroflexota bacterium]
MLLLRGWAQLPELPPMGSAYKLNPAGIAAYPMYRGLATVAKMNIIPTGKNFSDEVDTLKKNYDNHDFFFIHYKPADAPGEDGDFGAKVQALEDLDPLIPSIRDLNLIFLWLREIIRHLLSWQHTAGILSHSC